jgi:hypothetical protein
MSWVPSFIASLLFLSAYANAEPLKLFEVTHPASLWPRLSQNFNHAPSFHVLQNDPELAPYFTSATGSVTDLCIPSTMADVLLYQISQRTPRITMSVPGVAADGTVDGASTVQGLIQYCGFNPHSSANPGGSISWSDAGPCLVKFYQEKGYPNAKVKYIRLGQGANPGIDYEDRHPTLSDIQTALQAGNEVIAAISFQKMDPASGIWVQESSHAINLFGYGANPGDTMHLTTYLQNSNRLYSMNFIDPVFDIALFTDTGLPAPVATKASPIEITTLQGRLLNFPGKRTFLSAVVIIQPQ